jgi:membrane protein
LSTAADGNGGAPFGRVPGSPARLTVREWVAVSRRTLGGFLGDDAIGLSAQIAYSSLLAFFPTMIFLVAVLDLVDAFETVRDFLAPVAPQAVTSILDEVAARSSGSGGSLVALVLGALGAVWAASGAMSTVIKAVNRAWGTPQTRPFWKVRLTAVVLVLLTAVASFAMLFLVVFGGPLGEAIAARASLGSAWDWIWALVRWPIAFLAVLLFFALVYYLAPEESHRSWRWLSPGSLVGSVMWLALSALFALYTSLFGSYNETYGSIAGGIVLLLWLNYSAFALLFGAELNSELDRQANLRAAGGANAGLVAPARRGVSR